MCETTTLSCDMIALLDNVQILVISKKLVNKLHSVGFITSLWLGLHRGLLTRLVTLLLAVITLCNIRLVTVTILLRYHITLVSKVTCNILPVFIT